MPTLTIQLPGQPPVSHVLKDETITIGRMKGNTIVIEDTSISLMHAKITRKDGRFYLKDLNSTNGTMVNGQPIGEARLRDHDKVRFADITTQFSMEGDAAPAGSATVAAIPAGAPAPMANAAAAGAGPAASASASAQTHVAQKSVSMATSSARKPKRNLRILLVAGAVVLVALASGAFVVWKSMEPNSGKVEVAQARSENKANARVVAAQGGQRQVAQQKAAVVAAPSPTAAEPNSAASNIADLIASLKSPDVAERRQAASGLHGLGAEAKDAIPALKEALKDSDSEVQVWAALALVNTQAYDKGVIPILVRSLKNDNAVLRQVACLSLGLIPYQEGDKTSVVPALTDAAGKDPSEDVRQAAKSALNIIGAESGIGNAPENTAK